MMLKKGLTTIDYYYDIVSVPAWILLERFLRVKNQFDGAITLNFRPVHSNTLLILAGAGTSIPYSTAPLKKNYFEDQRLFARIHGLTISTPCDLIDKLIYEMSCSTLPQNGLNMVSTEYGQDKLVELSRILWRRLWIENKPIHSEADLTEAIKTAGIPELTAPEILFDERWCKIVNENHTNALDTKVCFDIPWTVLHSKDGSNKTFYGCDSWPLICSHMQISCKSFGDILL